MGSPKKSETDKSANRIGNLIESPTVLAEFVGSANLGIHSVDAAGIIKWANRFELDLLGYSESEYVGHSIVDFHADIKVIEDILNRLRNNEELNNFTARMKCKDGSIKYVSINSSVYREEGRFVHTRCFTRDISEAKNVEHLLAERTKLAELRSDISNILTNENHFITALQRCTESVVNHLQASFARIWTLNETRDALELKASAGRYTHLDGPHSRVKVGDFKIGRIAANKKAHLSNAVQSDPEVGDKAWAKREGMISFAGYPLMLENKVTGVLAMFSKSILSETILEELQFISNSIAQWVARKGAEAQTLRHKEWLQVTLQSIGDAVITTDTKGVVTYLNPVAETMCGTSAQAAIGQYITNVFNIQNESTKIQTLNIVESVLKSGTNLRFKENIVVISKNKSELPVEVNAAPIADANKAAFGVVIVFHDISDRRIRERQQELLIENATLYRRQSQRAAKEIDTVLDSIGKGALVLNADWTVKFINEQALEALGLERGEVENNVLWKLLPNEVKMSFTQQFSALLKNQFTIDLKDLAHLAGEVRELAIYPRENGELVLFVK